MAKLAKISMSAAIAACDGIVDRLDAGAGAGYIRIYDNTAARPASVGDAVPGTSVMLVQLTLSDPAFGAAADNTTKATATAGAVSSNTAAADGTASWFRAFDSDGNAIIDGNLGTSDADLVVDSLTFVTGVTVSVSSWTFSVGLGS